MNLGINNYNHNNYNPNFKARVNFNIEQTKGVWNEVAQIVEKGTKKYPDDIISIDLTRENLFDSACVNPGGRLFYMEEQGAIEMAKLSPKQIAKKIIKLFNIAKYEDSIMDQYDTFINKILKQDTKFKMMDPDFEKFTDDIWGPLYEKKSDTVTTTLDQDPVLKFITNK